MLTIRCFVGIALAAACFGVYGAFGRPVDLSAPSGALGAANANGYIEIWTEVAEISTSVPNFTLPLRFRFTSQPGVGGILGLGFVCPLLEANVQLIREKMVKAYLPCGKSLYLGRDLLNSEKFKTADGEWTGMLKGSDFVISRDDGWVLFYRQGRLISLTTDKGKVFTWIYDDGSKSAREIKENNNTIFSTTTGADGKLKSFLYDAESIDFTFKKRYLTSIDKNGFLVILGTVDSLSSCKWLNGKTESFEFSLADEKIPTLQFKNVENEQNLYSWNAANGLILSEGDWRYVVQGTTKKFGLPIISRTNSKKQKEETSIDNDLGVYRKVDSSGVTTLTYTFKTPGPRFGKVSKVEEVKGGKITTVFKAHYDEMGRLFNQTDENGFTTVFNYGDNGVLEGEKIYRPTDEGILSRLKTREIGLIEAISKTANASDKDEALYKLALFYIYENKTPDEANLLLSRVAEKDYIYRIKSQAICHDDTKTYLEKKQACEAMINNFPDKKDALGQLITFYAQMDRVYNKN